MPSLNAEQRALIEDVPVAYGRMWESIRPPYPCDFNGSETDIDVLDFIEYEAGHHPHGLEGAAVVFGNVLRHTGALEWTAGNKGSLLLESTHDSFPRYTIWPYARVLEIENSSAPQFGKYGWLLQKTLIDLLTQDLDSDFEQRVVALFDSDQEFWHFWPAAMNTLSRTSNNAT